MSRESKHALLGSCWRLHSAEGGSKAGDEEKQSPEQEASGLQRGVWRQKNQWLPDRFELLGEINHSGKELEEH